MEQLGQKPNQNGFKWGRGEKKLKAGSLVNSFKEFAAKGGSRPLLQPQYIQFKCSELKFQEMNVANQISINLVLSSSQACSQDLEANGCRDKQKSIPSFKELSGQAEETER